MKFQICAILLIFVSISSSFPNRGTSPSFTPNLDLGPNVKDLKESEEYLSNFVECITREEDALCDELGGFFKPRMEKALILDECPNCTLDQAAAISDMVHYLQTQKAEVYRALMVKLVSSLGIQVDQKEQSSARAVLNHIVRVPDYYN